jgi:hypothetical protein
VARDDPVHEREADAGPVELRIVVKALKTPKTTQE